MENFLNSPIGIFLYSLIVVIGIPVAIIIIAKPIGEALADLFDWLYKDD